MLREFRISELLTLLNSATPSIINKNLILDACTCDRTLLGLCPRFTSIGENEDKKCFENWELCLFRTELRKMFSNFLLYGSFLVVMTRILLIAAEMEQYIAIQSLT